MRRPPKPPKRKQREPTKQVLARSKSPPLDPADGRVGDVRGLRKLGLREPKLFPNAVEFISCHHVTNGYIVVALMSSALISFLRRARPSLALIFSALGVNMAYGSLTFRALRRIPLILA